MARFCQRPRLRPPPPCLTLPAPAAPPPPPLPPPPCQLWDVQNCAKVGEAPGAHAPAARDADWAPHNEHRVVTAGDDGKLRFWDTR
jgi:WD40 repeat protein